MSIEERLYDLRREVNEVQPVDFESMKRIVSELIETCIEAHCERCVHCEDFHRWDQCCCGEEKELCPGPQPCPGCTESNGGAHAVVKHCPPLCRTTSEREGPTR